MASNPPRYRQSHDLAFFFHQPLVEFSSAASSPFSCSPYCSLHYYHSTPALLLNSFAEAGVFQRLSGAGVTKAEGVGDDGVEPAKTPSPSIPISFPAGDSSSRGELLCMLPQARPPHARVCMAQRRDDATFFSGEERGRWRGPVEDSGVLRRGTVATASDSAPHSTPPSFLQPHHSTRHKASRNCRGVSASCASRSRVASRSLSRPLLTWELNCCQTL